MIFFLYNLAIFALSLVALPKFFLHWLFKKKYRQSLPQRLGISFPKIKKNGRPLVWMHAVSVGETKALQPLARLIKQRFPACSLIVSSITETGFAEAKKGLPEACCHVFLPFDFPWIVKRIIKRIQPDAVILSETDFWFNFLFFCKKEGAAIHLVNGKISQRSLKRYRLFAPFTKRLFSLIDTFSLQSVEYKDRFQLLGVPQEKMVVTGNLKLDATPKMLNDHERQSLKDKLGITSDQFVIIAGSTHQGEEEGILEQIEKLKPFIPNLYVIVVPRHPERFQKVAEIMTSKGVSFLRFTLCDQQSHQASLALIDAMGLLCHCYQVADIAVVCGSFTPAVGGHNIIEPLYFGTPVLYGPFMHAQQEFVKLVNAYGAGQEVLMESLADTLLYLFQHPDKRKHMGDSGKTLIAELAGAANKTLDFIIKRKRLC